MIGGLSMGGYVAWQFWKRHASRLDRLILCDTRAIADTPEAAAGRLKTAERVMAEPLTPEDESGSVFRPVEPRGTGT